MVCDQCKRGWQYGGGIKVEMSPATLEAALCDAHHIGSLHDEAQSLEAHRDDARASLARDRDARADNARTTKRSVATRLPTMRAPTKSSVALRMPRRRAQTKRQVAVRMPTTSAPTKRHAKRARHACAARHDRRRPSARGRRFRRRCVARSSIVIMAAAECRGVEPRAIAISTTCFQSRAAAVTPKTT
jgi:hypothetical protein